MKILNHNSKSATILSVLVAAFIFFSISSCAKKMVFATSTVAPAATGTVKIKKDKNNNYSINVSLRNLAPSDKLTPPRKTYIVWVETESNGVKNIGQVNTSSGLFSKKLKASLNAHLPFKPTNIFITAEDNQNVQYPGNMVVLTTK
jgi:hypothetical protein